MQYDKYVALDILGRVLRSIEHIKERSQPYHCGDDFLMSASGVAILDSICMQFIAIIIAHHYFDVDPDQIWWIVEHELLPLEMAINDMIELLR